MRSPPPELALVALLLAAAGPARGQDFNEVGNDCWDICMADGVLCLRELLFNWTLSASTKPFSVTRLCGFSI